MKTKTNIEKLDAKLKELGKQGLKGISMTLDPDPKVEMDKEKIAAGILNHIEVMESGEGMMDIEEMRKKFGHGE